MNRKVVLLAASAFIVAAAFAAQPTLLKVDDRQGEGALEREPWVPGANRLMSVHDATAPLPLAPPR